MDSSSSASIDLSLHLVSSLNIFVSLRRSDRDVNWDALMANREELRDLMPFLVLPLTELEDTLSVIRTCSIAGTPEYAARLATLSLPLPWSALARHYDSLHLLFCSLPSSRVPMEFIEQRLALAKQARSGSGFWPWWRLQQSPFDPRLLWRRVSVQPVRGQPDLSMSLSASSSMRQLWCVEEQNKRRLFISFF